MYISEEEHEVIPPKCLEIWRCIFLCCISSEPPPAPCMEWKSHGTPAPSHDLQGLLLVGSSSTWPSRGAVNAKFPIWTDRSRRRCSCRSKCSKTAVVHLGAIYISIGIYRGIDGAHRLRQVLLCRFTEGISVGDKGKSLHQFIRADILKKRRKKMKWRPPVIL